VHAVHIPGREKANGLPPHRRLRRSNEFARIERQGSRVHGAFVTLVARPSGHPQRGRVGFTVSKKVGNAVMRNFVKRRLRDIARRHKDAWQGRDLIVIARPQAAGQDLKALEADVLAMLHKLNHAAVASSVSKRGPHGKPSRR
jgi:ribonuclease P protein component